MTTYIIVSILLILALSAVLFFVIRTLVRARQRAKALERFQGIVDVEAEIAQRLAAKTEVEREIERLHAACFQYRGIVDLNQELAIREAAKKAADGEIERLRAEYQQKHAIFLKLARELGALGEAEEMESYGIYRPRYSYPDSQRYKDELERIRDRQRIMIRDDSATRCSTTWTVNGSEAKGRQQTAQYSKLMLRAFNGESDALVSSVKWNNVDRISGQMERSYASINRLGTVHSIVITPDYLALKLAELHLMYEYHEKLQREKEEQQRIKEEMREEEKARRELERAVKQADDEEKRYASALEKARAEVEQTKGRQLEKLNEKIGLLEQQLAQAQLRKERAVSQAQLTKSGHVYVISNVGSFGENVYKIGMTRRLEPMDRVKELGDASVPFAFDVHAIIYSENAPGLENSLHRHFHERRLNLVNLRKEFFSVSLDEIAQVVRTQRADIEFTMAAEAREYRESTAMRLSRAIPQFIEQPYTSESIGLPESLD